MGYGVNMNKNLEREMIKRAWDVSTWAIARKRKVGAVVINVNNDIFAGCNVEQDFCNSVHAEVNAILHMTTAGFTTFSAILIVSAIPGTTPCGKCMDWIMQFGGPDALIAATHIRADTQFLAWRRAEQHMPHYPI